MIKSSDRLLLVGDNPFHNISHLSQERARARTEDPSNPKYASHLILTAMQNGANGFTFSVSETTLAILKELQANDSLSHLRLFPVVPYAFEYVRLATQLGGIPGLAKKFAADTVKSGNIKAIGSGLKGVITTDPKALMKTYLAYELDRIKSSVDTKVNVESVLLHQLITDMALALDLDEIFKEYINFLSSRKITPGFNTGNFAYFVSKFKEWKLDLNKVLILAPFNKVGFQMTPSIEECEKALSFLPSPAVIAMSVLASGSVKPKEAAEYIAGLPNVRGVALGVSKQSQAHDTFQLFKQSLQ